MRFFYIVQKCLHCGRHCSAMRALFFKQKNVVGGVLFFMFSVPKAVGFGLAAGPTAIEFGMEARPKSYPQGVRSGLKSQTHHYRAWLTVRPTYLGSSWVIGLAERQIYWVVTPEILLISSKFNSDLCVAEHQICWVATPEILSISSEKVLITSKVFGAGSGLQPDPTVLGLPFSKTHRFFASFLFSNFIFFIQ